LASSNSIYLFYWGIKEGLNWRIIFLVASVQNFPRKALRREGFIGGLGPKGFNFLKFPIGFWDHWQGELGNIPCNVMVIFSN